MTDEEIDVAIRRLGRTTMLDPDVRRSARVRARCHVVIAEQTTRVGPAHRRAGLTTPLAPGLAYGLSLGYLAAMVVDLARVYLRR